MTPTKYFSAKNQAAAFLIIFFFVIQTVAQTATGTAPATISPIEKALADGITIESNGLYAGSIIDTGVCRLRKGLTTSVT